MLLTVTQPFSSSPLPTPVTGSFSESSRISNPHVITLCRKLSRNHDYRKLTARKLSDPHRRRRGSHSVPHVLFFPHRFCPTLFVGGRMWGLRVLRVPGGGG
ncbi:hypothetical protein XELAEV_18033690mg [Xenopus laevis]|uniref:Uncharacterized protein n=1 Tax=Xenopus laevis TaxID=8355 RepID=A0A974HE75_XENLA|nr:hypothetical protein XELAEV_18033690mg [Xenopus laevis]